jgi:hypothetical protein
MIMANEPNYNTLEHRMPFMMALLFEEEGEMPDAQEFYEKLLEKGYQVMPNWEAKGSQSWMFFLPEFSIEFDDGKEVPYTLMLLGFSENKEVRGNEMERSQFWRTPNGMDLLNSCPWQVFVGDFMSSTHPAPLRAKVLTDWLEIALDLFPACKGVWFESSRNVMTVETLRDNPHTGKHRIFHGAVNFRFFRVDNTEEVVIDSLGLHMLGIPDVQFHFRGLDPSLVVNLAYDIANYQLENEVLIKNNETISGFDAEGNYDERFRWKCRYETSLIEPKRRVLDVNVGEFAAGIRG